MLHLNPRYPFSALQGTEADTLSLLNRSAFEFHLTGSHFFGCARPSSDIDFIVQYSENVVALLEDMGFERMGTPGSERGDYGQYNGKNLMDDTFGVYELNNVHVQVVKDASITCTARDILSTHFADLHKNTRGERRRDMWNAAVALVKSVRNSAAEYEIDNLFN